MYLDPALAGVAWLLDSEDCAVADGLRSAGRRGADDVCDAAALAADLPDLLTLLRERHFGLVNGQSQADPDRLDAWAARWTDRLSAERPRTWGAALGSDLHQLRWLVGDNHLRAPGEDDELLRSVDVRSNPGGSDGFVRTWMGEHVPHDVTSVTDQIWRYDGRRLSYWNYGVYLRAVNGADGLPPSLQQGMPSPHPAGTLRVESETETFRAGPEPWHGRMLVLTDRRTASAGESVAWILREVFGAKVAGGRSAGCLTFGDLAPYLLPRSGLVVWLATHWFGRKDVELVGLPVDLEVDPRMPLDQIAGGFDTLYAEACH